MNSLILALTVFTSLPGDTPAEPMPTRDPLQVAYERFQASSEHTQAKLIAEITRRIEATEEPSLRHILDLRNRAVRELHVVEEEPIKFYDPDEFAPGQRPRHFVDEQSIDAVRATDRYFRYGAEPLFVGRVRYDFANNRGVDTGKELSAEDRLWNFFFGYVPESDVLVAWLQHKFDHRDDLDEIARHFEHAYADLNGRCFENIKLYDALSAAESVDMPDADVIAYARLILGDDSYISPIPPGSRQRALYEKVSDGFLLYFQHRTFTEYVSNLMLNAEAPLGFAHVTLRERILYFLAEEDLDLQSIRSRLIRLSNRGRFICEIDERSNEDPDWWTTLSESAERINQPRWVVANLTYDVLRDFGFLLEAAGLGDEAAAPEADEEAPPEVKTRNSD